MSAESLARDLGVLAKHYHAKRLRLLGGEPLLHPALVDILKIARASGVADEVSVATNGLLLCRQGDDFWAAVDAVDVTLYPGKALSLSDLWRCRARARRHRVRLRLEIAAHFRESYSELGTADEKLVQRIYDTCLIAHEWQCHNIENGHFYKCPQGAILPRQLPGRLGPASDNGVKLEETPELGRRIEKYLLSPRPLEACRHCLGSVGKRFPHEQVSRKLWRGYQHVPTEGLTDESRLEELESGRARGAGTHRAFRLDSPLGFLRALKELRGH
jgi:hypothetical protein